MALLFLNIYIAYCPHSLLLSMSLLITRKLAVLTIMCGNRQLLYVNILSLKPDFTFESVRGVVIIAATFI